METLKRVKLSEISVIHLNAGNDRNGNPRRVFVLNHPKHGTLCAIDEGYSGVDALRELLPVMSVAELRELKTAVTGRIPTTVAHYRDCLKYTVKNMTAEYLIVPV